MYNMALEKKENLKLISDIFSLFYQMYIVAAITIASKRRVLWDATMYILMETGKVKKIFQILVRYSFIAV